MKLDYSLVTRRTFLNVLFGGWAVAFCSGSVYAALKFAFPTLGKEPDFVILDAKSFSDMPPNSVKPCLGRKTGAYLQKPGRRDLRLERRLHPYGM